MSQYIDDHKMSPVDAMAAGVEAGAASLHVELNNGVIEVTNYQGSVMMQARNVKAGTWSALWDILENCGDIDFRAK